MTTLDLSSISPMKKSLLTLSIVFLVQLASAQVIKIDGSSTVYPLTNAIATFYLKSNPGTPIDIQVSGTGGGFKRFALGETVINNSSRKPTSKELFIMQQNGVEPYELPLAQDRIAVVVHKTNQFVKDLSLDELRLIWRKDSSVKLWSDVRSAWPNEEIKLYGPGTSSGTRDFFAEVLFEDIKQMRTDYEMSEDDDELELDVEREANALSFFGVAYVQKNENKVKVVGISDRGEPQLPNYRSIMTRQYPLTRTLYLHINQKELASNKSLNTFLNFYMRSLTNLAKAAGYIPLDARMYKKSLDEINQLSNQSLGK